MNNLTEGNIVFRRLNENDKDLFINLRMDFFMDYYNLNETEKKQIVNNLKRYFNDQATEVGYNLYKHLGFNDSKDRGMWLKI